MEAELWKIMKNDQLEFETNDNFLLCKICKKVLINAHYGPCGCRYCLECITNYLNSEENTCPGNTNDCKKELLYINRNIHSDPPMNMMISKLRVKCKVCEFQDELRNIENHTRVCNARIVECPFLSVGCGECSSDMKTHLLKEIVSHTKMLFESIDHLKNEIKLLKEDNIKLKNNNEELKKCINNLQLKFEDEIHKINENLKKDKMEFKGDHEDIKKCFCDLQNKFENENKSMNDKLREAKVELTQNEEELKKETATKIDEINKEITDLKSISNESDKSISKVMNTIRSLEKNQEQGNYGEFIWRINKWRDKMDQARVNIDPCIKSESFYSHKNGYKICLSVWPNGWGNGKETHLSVECYVKRGEYDDILLWPFKHDVTFELINQQTTQIHTSSTVKYGAHGSDSFIIYPNSAISYDKKNQKPKKENDSNLICYNQTFISLIELSQNPSLMINDQILIKFRVNR